MASIAVTGVVETGSYPVQATFPRPEHPSRLWAIPVVGLLIKELILIPHLVVLYVMGLVVELCGLVIWIPVLFTGKFPEFGYTLLGGYIRSTMRVGAYALGLTDKYPPFSDVADAAALPEVTFVRNDAPSRFFAIPVLGLAVKTVMLFPHIVAIAVLGAVLGLASLVIWIPVLFSGTFPQWAYALCSGLLRWSARVMAYQFGLTDKYPPFQLA